MKTDGLVLGKWEWHLAHGESPGSRQSWQLAATVVRASPSLVAHLESRAQGSPA